MEAKAPRSRKRRHAEVEPVEALDEAAAEGLLVDAPAPAVGDETAMIPVDAAAGDDEVLALEDEPEMHFACEAEGCGLTFARHGNLLRHERVVHRGERPLACEHCEKTFAYKADLVIHERSHTGERPFACDVEGCSHAYAYKSTLVVHMRSHTGERPFPCTVEGCSKAFVRPSKLRRHVREVHNGEKPYVCLEEGCGEAFVRRVKLHQHEVAVHGGGLAITAAPAAAGAGGPPEPETKKAFACDVVGCGASFVRRAGLNVHTSKVHAVV